MKQLSPPDSPDRPINAGNYTFTQFHLTDEEKRVNLSCCGCFTVLQLIKDALKWQ